MLNKNNNPIAKRIRTRSSPIALVLSLLVLLGAFSSFSHKAEAQVHVPCDTSGYTGTSDYSIDCTYPNTTGSGILETSITDSYGDYVNSSNGALQVSNLGSYYQANINQTGTSSYILSNFSNVYFNGVVAFYDQAGNYIGNYVTTPSDTAGSSAGVVEYVSTDGYPNARIMVDGGCSGISFNDCISGFNENSFAFIPPTFSGSVSTSTVFTYRDSLFVFSILIALMAIPLWNLLFSVIRPRKYYD